MRQKLHLPASAKIYVTVGRLGWFKGWQLMIDSFSLVYKKIPNSYLYFIGDGEDETKIREYISSMGLSNNIILLGRQLPNVISDFINAANVFIMGSMKEGWSTTLVEACACGVPCVVTNFSSAKEMIQNGKNGYVVEERNNNLFAERMIDCLNLDKETIREFNSKFDTLSVGKLKESLTCIWA
jgi:glycosyltransferase involved in cell wall biosynthesis